MDRKLALRATGVQLLTVAVLALATGLTLSHEFFEDWGWLVGPAAWLTASAITARVLRLDPRHTLIGAALAGIPSALATIAGLHWLGALLAVAVFGAWCGQRSVDEPRPA